jgi:hypothetical protein
MTVDDDLLGGFHAREYKYLQCEDCAGNKSVTSRGVNTPDADRKARASMVLSRGLAEAGTNSLS